MSTEEDRLQNIEIVEKVDREGAEIQEGIRRRWTGRPSPPSFAREP